MVALVARKVRDIYGNWVWQDDEKSTDKNISMKETTVKLGWKDWVALILAAMQTVLLPITVIIVLLIVFAVIFAH